MNKQRFFIAGTDTGVGKTCVSAALLHIAAERGKKTLGLKPIAAGCEQTAEGLRNEDALVLADVATCKLPYAQINPIALEQPISPHLAAQKAGKSITSGRLLGFCRGALMTPADFCLVEGAGGWRVPINDRETMADLAKGLGFPVILVVGMRLGCINHSLLTVEAILRDGLSLAGWVANSICHDMEALQENVTSLSNLIPAPCLGHVPFIADGNIKQISMHIDMSPAIKNR